MSEAAANELDQGLDPVQVETERRARNMGWRPRDEFRGDPDRWVDADEFVERGERLLPLLQERSRAADRTITDLRDQVTRQGETLNSMLQTARNAERVGYRRAMQELNEKRTQAVERGDMQAFAAVEQAIRELGPEPVAEPQRPAAPAPGQPQANHDPAVVAWVNRNAWFRNDPVANVAMIAAMQQVERERPGDSVDEHLLAAEAVIRRRFPEHFPAARRSGNGAASPQSEQRRPLYMAEDYGEEDEPVAQAPQSRRAVASAVARSNDGAPPRRPAPRSFDAMPPEVKAQYERQKKMLDGKGDPLTKEEFAAYYFEQEPE
jgi:hypothetical protein